MKKNVNTILGNIDIENKKLIDEINKSVLGISTELDIFFKNEKEGVILISAIYRFLCKRNSHIHNQDKYSMDISSKKEEGTIFASFERQDEIIKLKNEIQKNILDLFDIKIGYFDKNGSTGIYYSIPY